MSDHVTGPSDATAADELPDSLPPFDIAKALARTMGRRDLLRRMLLRFDADYADTAVRLRALIETGAFTEAARLAHTLKGLALTFEVGGIAEPAQRLELACADGALDRAPALIDQIEAALVPAIAAIRTLGPAPSGTVPAAVTADGAGLAARLEELDGLLARNSFKARRSFDGLRAELAALATPAQVAAVDAHLAALDFRAAAQALRVIRASLPACADA